ncbi:MAG: hypothetical protein AAB883_01465 [Patescibacteria group bacterium]
MTMLSAGPYLVTRRGLMGMSAGITMTAVTVATAVLVNANLHNEQGFSIDEAGAFEIFERTQNLRAAHELDYASILHTAWLLAGNAAGAAKRDVLWRFGKVMLDEYHISGPNKTRLTAYQNRATRTNRGIYDALDWDYIAKLYELSPARLRLLRQAALLVDGRMLLAIGMTEHRTSDTDGMRNKDYLDFRLRFGGSEFVERIPAQAGSLVSYGLYQFTSGALYDTPTIKRGASIPNQALPDRMQIPKLHTKLRGKNHTVAAYLYAVHNLACLMGRLETSAFQAFARVIESPSGSSALAVFVAAAHHHPPAALAAGHLWLSENSEVDLRRYADDRLAGYTRTASANYSAL